jgi:hypothetical protein
MSADKIRVIAASVRCQTFGWLSLLPLTRIAFSVLAFSQWGRVRAEAAEWNPARRQLRVGLLLASLGLLITLATLGVAMLIYTGNLDS